MEDCPICGNYIDVVVRYYALEPFIDGRNYDKICYTCANVPKTWEYDQSGEIVVYDHISPNRLRTVEEMMEEGWDKKEANDSIKAIKKLLKKPSFTVVPENGIHIFRQLFIDVQLD